jgi:putative DNA primase/helicase
MSCDPEPHVVVESSPGKYHAYWLVEDFPLEQFTPVMKTIAARFGGDKSVHDLPRVMRLPGFIHQKGAPFRSRLVHVAEGMPFDLTEILEAFPVGEASASTIGNGHDEDAQTMADLVRDVHTAENYHDALRNLAWRYLAAAMDPKDVMRTLQGLMDASPAPRDDRWQARYADIPRAVESAKEKLARTVGNLNLTDDALALEMGRAWESDSRYCAEWGKWLFWHGDRWEVDRIKWHLTRTRAWMRAKEASIVASRPAMARKAAALRDDSAIYAIDRLVTSNAELATTADAWDTDPMLLGGPMTVNLRTGKPRAPQPQDFILKRAACAPSCEPPALWLRCLKTWTNGDRDLQSYLQRFCGYLLTGSVEEEMFAFLYGLGKNGKTKFVETIKGIMGDYATTIGSEVLMWSSYERHPTEIATLRGIRLAVASEVEKGRTWAENRIKQLTGGDTLQARFMRQDFFTFKPQFKLLVVGNNKPSLRAVDEAIRRRLHLVPFTVTIPEAERDPHLAKKLEREWPQILGWMIDGCLAWQERGLDAPEIVQAATTEYLTAEDSFERWRDDCTTPDPNAWEPSSDLWDSWKTWASNAGEFVGSQKAFANALVEHGFNPHRKNAARGYHGAKLRRIPAIPPPAP